MDRVREEEGEKYERLFKRKAGYFTGSARLLLDER
jgi:hypothetical protein